MVRRVFKKLKRAKEEWDRAEPPQPGLEPIIGNIYGSPPADPRNCDVYPDSPFCGNPLTNKPISFEFTLVRDECNIGVQLDAAIGFIKMPPVQIVYRNPECIIPIPEPLPPLENQESLPFIPNSDADLWAVIENIEEGEQGRIYDFISKPQAWYERRRELNIKSFIINADFTSYFELEVTITEEFNGTHFVSRNLTEDNIGEFLVYETYNEQTLTAERETLSLEVLEMGESFTDYKTIYREIRFLEVSSRGGLTVLDNYSRVITYAGNKDELRNYLPGIFWAKNVNSVLRSDIYYGSRDADDFPLEIPGFEPGEIPLQSGSTDIYGNFYSGVGRNLRVYYFKRNVVVKPLDAPNIPNFPLSPPPPPMSCCPNVRENDELLRLIARRIGVNDYPVSVPKILTDRNQGIDTIENLTRLISWLGKNLDALCGMFPIKIKIKDADIDQEGDQAKEINIPNIAEGIAELLGLSLILRAESDANLNATIRTLTEAGAAKQAAIIATDYGKANAEFLAYKGTQVDREIPFTFKPGEPRLDKMLVNATVNVKGWDNDDKEDIKDLFTPLLELAAQYRAANYRNLGTSDIKESLIKTLTKKGFEAFLDTKINEDKASRTTDPDEIEKLKKSDFDQFTEEAERGFIDKTGITDSLKPYGRPLEQRPQIRQIGKTSD
ncbi:hypothetical protein NIES2101_23945 [Calothrix sp. HK-06]|nr:hypothetical protein NIES2101_23810 [Calothrix sp. HK-06]OKH47320.1 hypothetical protein NIES2101_23945 [Calothrix sp. HK-06]